MIFFTADTHFLSRGHLACFKRPFRNVPEMDQVMVDRWNLVVKPDDIVFHLGDFSIKGKFLNPAQLRELNAVFSRLNGRKILVEGNHDDQPVFDLPWEKQVYSTSIRINGQEIWLKHFPPKGAWPGKDKGAWCLYGHVHGRKRPKPNCFDVGVDCWDFRPIGFTEVRKRMERLKQSFRIP